MSNTNKNTTISILQKFLEVNKSPMWGGGSSLELSSISSSHQQGTAALPAHTAINATRHPHHPRNLPRLHSIHLPKNKNCHPVLPRSTPSNHQFQFQLVQSSPAHHSTAVSTRLQQRSGTPEHGSSCPPPSTEHEQSAVPRLFALDACD